MTNKRALFEISWEVCNMVGGIHTVISTKVPRMKELYGDNYIVIGPDVSRYSSLAGIFREEVWSKDVMKGLSSLKLGIKMGRWLIPGEPKALLLEFDSVFDKKDLILAEYWEKYGLNSLSGGHDYTEPVLFAHAAGMVVEQIFTTHYLNKGIEGVVHCHEWLAASAILYLKARAPEIGTVFTTHATMLGRTLSAHRVDPTVIPKEQFQPEYLAQQYGVAAKHSMESIAARVADCFTTVSEITGEECELLYRKKPDILTLNALSDSMPDPALLEPAMLKKTRERLLQLASLTTGHSYAQERTTFLVSAGRYEFQNKGLDLTLDTLSRLNRQRRESGLDPMDRVVAFLMFPAGHTGPRPKILSAFKQGQKTGEHYFSTHGLRDEEHDPIMTRVTPLGFRNGKEDPVHIVFVPIYLNGTDPLISETYYQLLSGADLSLFPSLYEPWGYTPEESAALRVPTVTSDLAGYGSWARQFGEANSTGIFVLKRKNRSFEDCRDDLYAHLEEFLRKSPAQREALRSAVFEISKKAHWHGPFGEAYAQAHERAIQQAKLRMDSATYDRFRAFSATQVMPPSEGARTSAHIRRFTVHNKLPSVLERIRTLLKNNIWWSWNPELTKLLSELDEDLWLHCAQNPLLFIDRLKPEVLETVNKSKTYLERAELLLSRFAHYMSGKKPPELAYFCLEYGLTHILRLYSGGLGILAGDHLKTASDMSIPLCAVGLAYKFGYFTQRINADGVQEAHYDASDFGTLPISPVLDHKEKQLKMSIPWPYGDLWFQVWKVNVGRVDLYLLDTDIPENPADVRAISDRLYGGDTEHRLKQEFLLAIGGFQLLEKLDLKIKAYHMNEGHTGFLVLARMADLVRTQKMGFEDALEYVRHTMGFTTHTPVSAGHDHFPEAMVAPYLQLFTQPLGVELPKLQALGKTIDKSKGNAFSMTLLAVRGSAHLNGVSRIHGKVSRRMFHSLVPQHHESEVPVMGITNGVHAGTWIAPEWQTIFNQHLGSEWREHLSEPMFWNKIRDLDPQLVWDVRNKLKGKLLHWLRAHLKETFERRREHPSNLATALANLNEDTFVATFARRFAPYKRAHMLFRDPERLAKMMGAAHPMVFLFAGKAHPNDGLGQSIITKVIELARKPEFSGRVIFVENYEIDVAQLLVWGSDMWINNPIRPLEASGTSGMKAAMNGCLNFSVADGWWAEAYNGKNGWVIGEESLTQSAEFQDTFDSSHAYSLLEREVLPKYFSRSRGGVPEQWVKAVKESIASIVPTFNTERMLAEYDHHYYKPALEQASSMTLDKFDPVKKLTASRRRLQENWNSIAFIDIDVHGLDGEEIVLGQDCKMKVRLAHPNLRAQDILVQTVVSNESAAGASSQFGAFSMKCVADDTDGRESTWETSLKFNQTGQLALGVRVVPRPCHENHAVDIRLDMVKWL